jgi:membrane protease YdiL (CAAX protease family)
MKTSWLLFRIVCLLQMLATVFLSFISLISFFNTGRFADVLETIAFALVALLAIFALNLLNTNYPDKPVAGKQKSIFNWLFLLNFLLLAFLFAHFFADYASLKKIGELTGRSVFSFSFNLWWPVLLFITIIVFQFIILYGLFILRRLLYLNFYGHRQFEFEDQRRD